MMQSQGLLKEGRCFVLVLKVSCPMQPAAQTATMPDYKLCLSAVVAYIGDMISHEGWHVCVKHSLDEESALQQLAPNDMVH